MSTTNTSSPFMGLFIALGIAITIAAGGFFLFQAGDRGVKPVSRDIVLEDRFLDECQFAPQGPANPDGTLPPRQARNPFPLCYLELQKSKQPQVQVTLPAAPAAAPALPVSKK
jgi:hypothetical protein